MSKPKPGQKRDIQIHFWVNSEEEALIRDRMASLGVTSLSAYMRKMGIDGLIVNLDLSDIRELTSLLRYSANNLNQYAKRANETGSIYAADIEDLRTRFDELRDAAGDILRKLSKL